MLGFIQFFTLQRQLILFAISVASIIAFHVAWGWGGFAGSWFFIIIMLVLVVKHLLLGTVNAAVMKLQMQDFDAADKLLNYTFRPSWLRFGYHGMYYVIKSQLAFQKKDLKNSEIYSRKALEQDMPDDDTQAMVYLQLIGIYAQKSSIGGGQQQIKIQHKTKIKEFLQKAKKLNVRNPQIKEQIKEMDKMLKGQPTQAQRKMMGKRQKTAMNQGYMRRGRKR